MIDKTTVTVSATLTPNPTGTNGIASVSPEALQMVTYSCRLPASHNIVFFLCLWFTDDSKTTIIVAACVAGGFLCTCVLFMACVIKWNSSRGLSWLASYRCLCYQTFPGNYITDFTGYSYCKFLGSYFKRYLFCWCDSNTSLWPYLVLPQALEFWTFTE